MENSNKDATLESVVVSDNEDLKKNKSRKKRGKKFIALYIAGGIFIVYAVIALVSQQSQISQKQAKLDRLNQKIEVQELKNDELNDIYNLSDKDNEEYIEKKAKERSSIQCGNWDRRLRGY